MSRLIVPVSARAWSRVRWPATVRSVVWAIWLIAARTFSIASSAGGLSPQAAGPAALPAVPRRRDPDPMKGWFAHRDFADRDAADLGKLDDLLPSPPHVVADRACCCPARPVVTVIMPAAPGRPHPVDLLLCGHHFRVSQAALTAAGAAVYDNTGALIAGGVSEYEHDLHEHAAAA